MRLIRGCVLEICCLESSKVYMSNSAPKTKKTTKSVSAYIAAIKDEQKRADAKKLLALMKEVTGMKPALWGDSIVGFGEYHYKYASGRESDWPLTGFSARSQNFTVYIMPGFKEYGALLKKLGSHKHSVSCLYIKRLSDIHLPTLRRLVQVSVKEMKKMYKVE
jgi:hypothetical protein